MINIWKYYIGDSVEIEDIYGNKVVGIVECQIAEDEMENELDFISIISDGKQYGYNINELKSIKALFYIPFLVILVPLVRPTLPPEA